MPAWPSDAFVESVGVCVNLAAEPYKSHYDRFRQSIAGSHIRHLRANLDPDDDAGRWRDLFQHVGLRRHLLTTPLNGSATDVLSHVMQFGVEHFSAVEGQNEGDGWFASQPGSKGNWAGTTVAYQRDLFRVLRSRYAPGQLPVVSPTLLDWKPGDVAQIKAAAAFCDLVGIHSYVQHAQEPETPDAYSALAWYLRNYRDAFKPGAPAMVTEAGYYNVVAGGTPGISERASSVYLPRLLLHNFGAGIVRTFLYEFMDSGRNPADSEAHYGLVHFDCTPKPAYHTVRGLLAALADAGGAGSEVPPVDVSIDGAPSDLRKLAFAARDRRVTLALWRPLRVWDVGAAADIATPEQDVSIATAQRPARAAYMVLDGRNTWHETPASGVGIRVPVGARVTLLRLEPRLG